MAYNNIVNDLQRKKIDNEQIYKDLENKNGEIESLKLKHHHEINLLKNEISNLKKRENIYKETLSRLKNHNSTTDLLNKTSSFSNQQLNKSNIINAQNINNNQLTMSPNVNTSFMTYNPPKNNELNNSTFEKDDSFKYSYFLIDNLKKAINKVDFQNEYSNLL